MSNLYNVGTLEADIVRVKKLLQANKVLINCLEADSFCGPALDDIVKYVVDHISFIATIPPWDINDTPYIQYQPVTSGSAIYISLIDDNSTNPLTTPANWLKIAGNDLIEGPGIDISFSGTDATIATKNGRGIVYDNNDANTLDLESKTLVSPTINPSWTLYQNNGTTPYMTPTSTAKNITVDLGVIANLSATYSYPVPGSTEAPPTSVTGDFGTVLPPPATPSTPLVVNNITANTTETVNLIKPKSGLIVVGSQVQFASGNDITTDSISITYRGRSYLGYSANIILSPSDILALDNKAFSASRVRTINNVTAGVGLYTYIVYNASFGDLTNIIMDGAAPVLGAFTKLSNVNVTNDAGISVAMIVYKSNATNAFTNNSLALS